MKFNLTGLAIVAAAFSFTVPVMAAASSGANEALIRKSLQASIPQIKTVDEVSKSPIAGLYEVRVNGRDIIYTDATGKFFVQGSIVELPNKRNITEERVSALTAIKYSTLPEKDAITIVRGDGSRKLAIFEDPNCGYCKRFERDLKNVDNITLHVYLYPILGADSQEKAKAVWCAKDPAKAWHEMMVGDVAVAAADASCDVSAITRNVNFGREYKINGTPALFFANGKRVPGAIDSAAIEKLLAEAK